VIFKGLSKVKSIASSYVLLRAKQFLSETFLSAGFSFRYWTESFKMGQPV